MILIEDVIGTYKRTLYGTKGEVVAVVVDRGNVLIVENVKGERYAVKKEKVKWQGTE